MYYFLFFIAGLLLGSVISHYTAYLINKSPDCVRQIEHKIISKRTIFVSLVNGILWEYVYISNGISALALIYAIVSSILLSLSIVDIAIFEIPPQFNWILLVLGIVVLALDKSNWFVYAIGSILVSGLFFLIALVTKGKGMGGGDIKLMFTCGLMLGWQKIICVMFIGSVLGSIIHITLMKVTKKERMLAFGPYLSAGVYIMMCYGTQIINWYITNFLTFETM